MLTVVECGFESFSQWSQELSIGLPDWTDMLEKLIGSLVERELLSESFDFPEIKSCCLPPCQEDRPPGYFRSDIRVAVAIAAHPRTETNRGGV